MTGRRRTAAIGAAFAMGALGFGCATAASLQNYDKVSLGMTADQVLTVAGKPNSKFKMESTGQGTIIPTPAGASDTWFYKGGMIQFHDGKVVAKGVKTE
jgi:hypothetical protein